MTQDFALLWCRISKGFRLWFSFLSGSSQDFSEIFWKKSHSWSSLYKIWSGHRILSSGTLLLFEPNTYKYPDPEQGPVLVPHVRVLNLYVEETNLDFYVYVQNGYVYVYVYSKYGKKYFSRLFKYFSILDSMQFKKIDLALRSTMSTVTKSVIAKRHLVLTTYVFSNFTQAWNMVLFYQRFCSE
jgi:hypothetical protein